MKMICSQTKCRHKTCVCRVPHEPSEACNRVNKVCKPYVPVRPRRKPVTVWRVYIDFDNRADARADAKCLREECWHHDRQVRGPVKVVLP